jgi:hypothetical protein
MTLAPRKVVTFHHSAILKEKINQSASKARIEKRTIMAKKTKKQWVYAPTKSPKPAVSDELKAEVRKKADELVEAFLKTNFIKPPPTDTQWNYIVDIYTKWYRGNLCFCSKYRCPAPNCISEFFEDKFARLE